MSAKARRIAAVLRAALPHLWDGTEPRRGEFYVCYAIDHVALPRRRRKEAGRYIGSLIDRSAFVTTWLFREHGILLDKVESQQYRHAWVRHMIKELES